MPVMTKKREEVARVTHTKTQLLTMIFNPFQISKLGCSQESSYFIVPVHPSSGPSFVFSTFKYLLGYNMKITEMGTRSTA